MLISEAQPRALPPLAGLAEASALVDAALEELLATEQELERQLTELRRYMTAASVTSERDDRVQ